MNKRWRNAGLYALLAIVVIALATALVEKQPPSRDVWKYSQFIQEVEGKRVDKINISSDRSKALVTAQDGNKVIVKPAQRPRTDQHPDQKQRRHFSSAPKRRRLLGKSPQQPVLPDPALGGTVFPGAARAKRARQPSHELRQIQS